MVRITTAIPTMTLSCHELRVPCTAKERRLKQQVFYKQIKFIHVSKKILSNILLRPSHTHFRKRIEDGCTNISNPPTSPTYGEKNKAEHKKTMSGWAAQSRAHTHAKILWSMVMVSSYTQCLHKLEHFDTPLFWSLEVWRHFEVSNIKNKGTSVFAAALS